MCNPLALGIAAGGATAVTGIMQQNRQHKAQVDAVNRSNAIARQKYINDITISAYNDQRKVRYLQLSYKLMLQPDHLYINKEK